MTPPRDPSSRDTSLRRELLSASRSSSSAVFLGGRARRLRPPRHAHPAEPSVSVRASVGILGSTVLAYPIVWLLGWPAAALTPVVPAVHALRLFGRLESETDRSWMIFFAGVVLLLPIALALALPAPPPGLASPMSGMWGAFCALYAVKLFGGFGAWVVVALAGCRLLRPPPLAVESSFAR